MQKEEECPNQYSYLEFWVGPDIHTDLVIKENTNEKMTSPTIIFAPILSTFKCSSILLTHRGQSLLIFTMKSRSNGFLYIPLWEVFSGEEKKKTYLATLWLNKRRCKSHQRKEAVSMK